MRSSAAFTASVGLTSPRLMAAPRWLSLIHTSMCIRDSFSAITTLVRISRHLSLVSWLTTCRTTVGSVFSTTVPSAAVTVWTT